jgi:hypothetical protein
MTWRDLSYAGNLYRWRLLPPATPGSIEDGQVSPVLEVRDASGFWLRCELGDRIRVAALLGPARLPGRGNHGLPCTVGVLVRLGLRAVTDETISTLLDQLMHRHRKRRYRGRIVDALPKHVCARLGLDPRVWARDFPLSDRDRDESDRRLAYLDRQEESDKEYTHRLCDNCKQPITSWRRTCKRCGRPV